MKAAYITTYDKSDIDGWSGTGYFMARSLAQQSIDLSHIDSLKSPLLIRARRFASKLSIGKRYLSDRDPLLLKSYSRQINEGLKDLDIDLIFSPGTIPISYLETDKPIVFWTDATFAGMIDYYPEFTNLSAASIEAGNLAEQMALSRCSLAIYASEWAARTAIDNYSVDESKVKVVPFGANIDCDRSYEDIRTIIDLRRRDVCKLVFIGVDWQRKGGDIALAVAKELNNRGFKTELTIVGCAPQIKESLPSFVTVKGFISKSSPDGISILAKLIGESHFLIVPSKSECYGIVYCEAGSFGVPSLAVSTGGVPAVIRNGINGRTFAPSAKPYEYCRHIIESMADPQKYKELALSSFNEYQTRLNWRVAGRRVRMLIEEEIAHEKRNAKHAK